MAFDLGTYIIVIWIELTLFAVVIPLCLTVLILYKVRAPFILNLLRKRFMYHFVIDGVRLAQHVVMMKDTRVKGATRFIPFGKEWYVYNPKKEFMFYWNNTPAIAHRAHDPTPIKFAETGGIVMLSSADGEYPAQEVHDAIESKVAEDFNRSIYDKKDFLIMIMIFGIAVLGVINIYFTWQTSNQMSSILNYFAHYFSTSPVP